MPTVLFSSLLLLLPSFFFPPSAPGVPALLVFCVYLSMPTVLFSPLLLLLLPSFFFPPSAPGGPALLVLCVHVSILRFLRLRSRDIDTYTRNAPDPLCAHARIPPSIA